MSRFWNTLTWALPAAVFLLSGGAKVIAPDGVPPEALSWVSDYISYHSLLRVLGAVEVICALMLLRPRTRRMGRVSIGAMLLGFTWVIATHAADTNFIQNCGCFGVLDAAAMDGQEQAFLWMVSRNSVLFALVICGLRVPRLPTQTQKSELENKAAPQILLRMTTLPLLLWLAAMWQGQVGFRSADRDLLFAMDRGNAHSRYLGWELPDLSLQQSDGTPIATTSALRSGDHLIFFSPTCEHCKKMRPAWGRFAHQLEQRNLRMVLLVVSEADQLDTYKEGFDLDHIPVFLIQDRLAMASTGVVTVPSMLILGEDRQVIYNGALNWQKTSTSISPDLGEESRSRIVHARGGDRPAYFVDLAIQLSRENRIIHITPTFLGDYAKTVSPEMNGLPILLNKTLPEALQIASGLAAAPTMEAPIWNSITIALSKAFSATETAKAAK